MGKGDLPEGGDEQLHLQAQRQQRRDDGIDDYQAGTQRDRARPNVIWACWTWQPISVAWQKRGSRHRERVMHGRVPDDVQHYQVRTSAPDAAATLPSTVAMKVTSAATGCMLPLLL